MYDLFSHEFNRSTHWELNIADPKYGLKVPQDDSYDPSYDPNNLPMESAGTWFEEETVRQTEANFMRELLDSKDWSYDPTNINQGKQWNK